MKKHEVAMMTMLAAALIAGAPASAQCPPKYEVTAIFTGPNCFGSPATPQAWDINDATQVAGYTSCVGSDNGFVWSEALGFVSLSPPAGISQVQVFGINNIFGSNSIGQMTGEMKPSGTSNRAFLLSDGTWTNLGTLPEAAISGGRGVNDQTTIAGYASHPVTGFRQAFKWEEGTLTKLTGFGEVKTEARDINNNGQITGWMYTHLLQDARAFIWQDGDVIELPPVPDGTTSQGRAINVHADVTGRGKFFDPQWNANVWRGYAYIKGQAVRIDPLPGFKDVSPQDINASRQVVGFCQTTTQRAFLWQKGEMYDLNELLPMGSPVIGLARAIDDQGRIAAYSATPGQPYGFLLSPVGPPAGDFTCDGTVGVADLLILLGAWGPCRDPITCHLDLNDDGAVGVTDLLILLANWG